MKLINQSLNFKVVRFNKDEHKGLIGPLTEIIHEAYGALAKKGMRYLASYQSEEKTLERLCDGRSYLGYIGDELVSTITIRIDTPDCPLTYYQNPDVAFFTQFAVKPSYQGKGIGKDLMDFIEFEAVAMGASFLALDTSEHASGLIAMYEKRGHKIIGNHNWDETNYISVIMSKELKK